MFLITMAIILIALIAAFTYVVGTLCGYKEFDKINNDYGKRLVDLFTSYVDQTENIYDVAISVYSNIFTYKSEESIEKIAEAVHNAWWEEKKKQGCADHPDMLPYADLAEDVKEYDRVTAKAVLDALRLM